MSADAMSENIILRNLAEKADIIATELAARGEGILGSARPAINDKTRVIDTRAGVDEALDTLRLAQGARGHKNDLALREAKGSPMVRKVWPKNGFIGPERNIIKLLFRNTSIQQDAFNTGRDIGHRVSRSVDRVAPDTNGRRSSP